MNSVRGYCSLFLCRLAKAPRWLPAAAFWLSLSYIASAAVARQAIDLVPGWNAVYLEVTPYQNDVETVFRPLTGAGVLKGVWRHRSETSTVQFVQQPNQLLEDIPEWLTWFPNQGAKSVLKTLHAIHGGHCYLIELLPTASPVTLNLSGVQVTRPFSWSKGHYTLTGFPVDPAAAPAFTSWFSGTTAHPVASMRKMDAATGQWVALASGETITRGRAYWIYSNDISTFQGPASVEGEANGSLDFAEFVVERPFIMKNGSPAATAFNIRVGSVGGAGTAGGLALSVYNDWSGTLDTNGDGVPDLPGWVPVGVAPISVPVLGNASRTVRLGIRRQDMAGQGRDLPFESLLEVTNSAGTLHRIETRAGGFLSAGDPARFAGLWIGNAVIDRVQQISGNAAAASQAVSSEASLRLIVHVSESGETRLLREAIVMWLEGITDSSTGQITDAGRFLVFADGNAITAWKSRNPALQSRLKGVGEKGGKNVGQRISSAGFTFTGSGTFNGNFGSGVTSVTIQTTAVSSNGLNPYRHQYHPSHTNGLAFSRAISLSFSSFAGGPGDALKGVYAEAISGLSRNPVNVSGSFSFSRALGPVGYFEN